MSNPYGPPPGGGRGQPPPNYPGQQGQPPYQGPQAQPPYQGQQGQPPYQGPQAQPPHQGQQRQPLYQGQQGQQGQPPYQGPQAQPQYQVPQGQVPPAYYGYGPQGQAQPPYYGQRPAAPYPQHAPPPVNMVDPDRARRTAGLAIWVAMMGLGILLNILFQLVVVFGSKNPGRMIDAVMTGTLTAFLPLGLYLFVPLIIDRYDPEPWWCLAMAFLWGAVVATGFAGFINTMFAAVAGGLLGAHDGEIITKVVCAPVVEEFFKGLAVLGAFFFLRREFDGIVDGIIYATFCALGFAAVENIDYYARSEVQHQLGSVFFLRGVIAPWGHPLYTSMTGIGFGIARETDKAWLRVLAPLGGYAVGVCMHATWNLIPTIFPGQVFLLLLPLWILFAFGFFAMIIALVIRKGRTIRSFLRDEVLLGNLSQAEVDLICSPVGRLQCTFSWRGAPGRAFIGAGARLALSKWHTARAMRGQKRTISSEFIHPMRVELHRLRGELATRMPR